MTTAELPPEEAPWLRLVIHTHDCTEHLDALSQTLRAAGADSIEVQDESTLPSPLDPEALSPGTARLIVYLQGMTTLSIANLQEQLGEQARALRAPFDLKISPFSDTSWRDGWKDFFQPAQISPRIAIRAPWIEFEVDEGVEVLVIEPGMAFGTGLHETTRLCLKTLDHLLQEETPETLLDVGCGSGVLSIAAARLGVSHIVAVDHDPISAKVTKENAALNNVPDAITASTTPASDVPGTFPIVLANILAHILLSLRDDLIARTAPGGRLIMSGLLETERESFTARFCENGAMTCEHIDKDGEWAMIVLRRA